MAVTLRFSLPSRVRLPASATAFSYSTSWSFFAAELVTYPLNGYAEDCSVNMILVASAVSGSLRQRRCCLMPFDPYYEWLGIPRDEQPADHYRLLGIRRFEPNPAVIENAAERQLLLLKTMQHGPRGGLTQQLMNEISAARICLLDPRKRSEYDAKLRQPDADRETQEQEFDLGPPAADGRSHGSQEFNLAPPSHELQLAPSDDDGPLHEVQLPPSDAARRWHELRLAPSDADRQGQELKQPQRAVDKTVTNRRSPEVLRPDIKALPVLEPLQPDGPGPLDPVSRRRLSGVSKIPRKPKHSRVQRPVQRVSSGRNALMIFGGLAAGLYIGATLILIWFYGGGGRSRAVEDRTHQEDSGASNIDADRERDGQRTAPGSIRKTSVIRQSQPRVPIIALNERGDSRIGQTGELTAYGKRP